MDISLLQQLLDAVNGLRRDFDVFAAPGQIVGPNLKLVLDGLRLFVFSTADPFDPGRPFIAADPIRRFEPLMQALADAALTLALVWGSFRIMFAHGFRNQHTARILLPRALLAVVLINFSMPLMQAAIDATNVVSQTVMSVDAVDHLKVLGRWFTDAGAPGLQPITVTVLFCSYGLLAIAYIVRFALMVVLAILAPLAALAFVLPETHHYGREWGTLFLGALLMQPLQLFVIQIGFALDASFEHNSIYPVRHLFALAAVFLAFKVPGALSTASRVGTKAASLAKRESEHAYHAAVHVLAKV